MVIMPIPPENVTVYTLTGFGTSAAVIFDLEGDRISSLSIDSTMVSERGVVLSESLQVLKIHLYDFITFQATAFQEHPYHWPVRL
jgi:hypothetical protein